MLELEPKRVPPVLVPFIDAGEALLELNVLYQIPEQPFSALYIPQTDEVVFDIGEERIAATVGDIVAVPRGHRHSMRLPGGSISRRSTVQPPFSTTPLRDDVLSRLFCCRVPTSANPMPDIVPDVLHYKPEKQREFGRLDLIFDLIRHHAIHTGMNRQAKLRRLAEIAAVTFLEGVIDEFEKQGLRLEDAAGDPQVRRALNLIHREPGTVLNLETLASTAGLSRSAFADRFKTATGKSPMAYVSDHRLGLAARMLDKDQLSVSQVSAAVGFDTDSAFSKAFRKQYGISPSMFRTKQRR